MTDDRSWKTPVSGTDAFWRLTREDPRLNEAVGQGSKEQGAKGKGQKEQGVGARENIEDRHPSPACLVRQPLFGWMTRSPVPNIQLIRGNSCNLATPSSPLAGGSVVDKNSRSASTEQENIE